MKVVILAGGLGTRMAEETEVKPKPMVEIGARPILWHIMKLYAHYGFNEFLIALGYKGDVIKRFFLDYYRMNGSMTVNLWNGDALMHHKKAEDWTVKNCLRFILPAMIELLVGLAPSHLEVLLPDLRVGLV